MSSTPSADDPDEIDQRHIDSPKTQKRARNDRGTQRSKQRPVEEQPTENGYFTPDDEEGSNIQGSSNAMPSKGRPVVSISALT